MRIQFNNNKFSFISSFILGDKNLLDIILKKPHLDVNLTNNNNKYPEEETENEEIVEYYK